MYMCLNICLLIVLFVQSVMHYLTCECMSWLMCMCCLLHHHEDDVLHHPELPAEDGDDGHHPDDDHA